MSRILHVSDCYLPRTGGIERHVHDLAVRQLTRGDHVEVLTTTAGEPVGDVTDVWRPTVGVSGQIRYRAYAGTAAELHRSRPDVVHVHASTFSPLGYAAVREAVRASIPVAMTVHSLWGYATPIFTATSGLFGWGDWPVAWSAVSDRAAQAVRRATGAPVGVVPNGVDASWWRPAGREPRPGPVTLVSVLRMSLRKRPLPLLRILHRVRRQLPEQRAVSAVLIGAGPAADTVRRVLDTTGMASWVRLAGPLRRVEVRAALHAADLYVAPARLESFGLAALEARAAGLPVVAYQDTGIAGFVEHGRTGLLAGSDRALADAVAGLVADDQRRRAMTDRAMRVAPTFTWPAAVGAVDDLYARATVLAGQSAGAPTGPRSRARR